MAHIELTELKELLVENCMLKMDVDEISEDTPLFGPGSVGLDSIDALQLTVAVEKKYGTPITDPQIARQVLENLGSLRTWLTRQLDA
ncbi:phosphopantetheine-binding protein [Verrucomicrobia bacterium LW23]|nr:phosphopantetheine-binding protein [Verrucomicrobia bacterium LW23]